MSIESAGLLPWLGLDGRAVGRINPPAVDEHRGVLPVPQQRRQDVDARRSVPPTERVDDFLRVIVAPADVNPAEVCGGGITRQRVDVYFWREPSRSEEVVRALSLPKSSDLPEAEKDENDRERDREDAEDPFPETHPGNIALVDELPLGANPEHSALFRSIRVNPSSWMPKRALEASLEQRHLLAEQIWIHRTLAQSNLEISRRRRAMS